MRQPPDRENGGPPEPPLPPDDPAAATASGPKPAIRVTGDGVTARVCCQCGEPLPRHKKRFCSDPCRIKKQLAEQNSRRRDNRPPCCQCGQPLPRHKQRFCSDLCERKQRRVERTYETPEITAWVAAAIKKMGILAAADLGALYELAALTGNIHQALEFAVEGCRRAGYSDTEIGEALDISRQAVGQRFGRKREVYAGTAGGGTGG
jgi:hypothetical protein